MPKSESRSELAPTTPGSPTAATGHADTLPAPASDPARAPTQNANAPTSGNKSRPELAPTAPGSPAAATDRADILPAPAIDPARAPTQNANAPTRGNKSATDDLLLVAIPGAIPAPLKNWERYEIIRPLGQGGMGSVFLARDRRLGRMVALKFLRVPSPDAAERLLQEARAQARLDHGNICKVFEVGEFLGQPYIAMEFINGQPLYTAVQRLSLDQKVVLLRQVAVAVHVAHSNGVLHRDLKPANVMVCSVEEPEQAPGLLRPVLMDFGLARDSLGPQRLTQTGIIMGTPHYMAPEQARGQARHLDRRADVYSLGAMLYELLTGRPPFDADNEVDLLLSVLHQDPQPPRSVEPSVPIDLEIITLKCLCKEPEQRYESAQALADDLQRYLNSEPIVARPASTLYRLRRLALRHRARVAIAAVIACSLVALLVVSLRARTQQRLAAQQAQVQHQHDKEQQELAGVLGQTVTEMKLFLRVAYSLPPHDLGREQLIIRDRLGKLEQQLTDKEPYLRGTIESALGEGYLALEEYPQAMEHLRRALTLGQKTPGVHLALGQAQGQLYEQKLNELRSRQQVKSGDPEYEKLKQAYLVPARQELLLGNGAALTTPAYITALGYFYDGEAAYPQALKFARAAQEEAPWLIEPVAMETKIVVAQFKNKQAQGDISAQKDDPAVRDTISRAIGIARSYPAFYRDYAVYFGAAITMAMWESTEYSVVEPIFRAAIANAQTMVMLQPKSRDAHNQLAEVYKDIIYLQMARHYDPDAALQQGVAAIDRALEISPPQARSYALRSHMHRYFGGYLDDIGSDPLPRGISAVDDMKKAIELEPRNPEYWRTQSLNLYSLAEYKEQRGEPWEQEVHAAISAAEHAIELRPGNIPAQSALIASHIKLATYLSATGKPADAEFATIRTLTQEIEAKNGSSIYLVINNLAVNTAETADLLNRGQDAVSAAHRTLEAARAYADKYPQNPDIKAEQTKAYQLYVKVLLAQKQAAGPVIDEAIAVVEHASNDALNAVQRAALKISLLALRVRWLQQSGKSPEPALRAVLAATLPATQTAAGSKRLQALEARSTVLRIWSDWLLSQGQTQLARAAVNEGLATYAAAVGGNCRASPLLQAEQGVLLTLQARLMNEPGERRKQTTQAVAILTRVMRERPPLAREFQPYLQVAQKLAGEAGKTAPL